MFDLTLGFDRPARSLGGRSEHVLRARLTPRGGGTEPLRVAIALDTSGSMGEGGKMAAARRVVQAVVALLRPGDRVSVAGFANTVREVIADQDAGTTRPAKVLSALAALEPDGVTRADLAIGWLARTLTAGDGARVALLVTDGRPTNPHGDEIEDTAPLLPPVAALALSGATVSAVGFGDASCFNTAFLVALADRGQGRFLYAPTQDALEPELATFIGQAKATKAASVRLTLTPRPGVELLGCCVLAPAYRPMDRPSAVPWSLALPNVRGDVPTDVLVRLTVPPPPFGARPGPLEVLSVAADPGAEAVASVQLASSYVEAQRLDPEIDRARLDWLMNACGDALLVSPSLVRTGELLDALADAAQRAARPDIAADAQSQRDALVASGQIPPHHLASSLTRLRTVGVDP